MDPNESEAVEWLLKQWGDYCDRRVWESEIATTIIVTTRLLELEKTYRDGGRDRAADLCYLMLRVLRGIPLPPSRDRVKKWATSQS